VILKNIWYKYPLMQDWVLRDINLELDKGMTGILGPNGSGKTTLLHIISGYLKPQKGEVIISGKKIKSLSDTVGKVIYVPQNAKLFLIGPTVRDDIERAINASENNSSADEIMEIFHLTSLKEKKIYNISEGERRLVALASAYAYQAEVYLLDEPSIGLDKRLRNAFLDAYSELSRKSIVIIATNDTRLIGRMDHLVILNQGKVILEGPTREVVYEFPKIRGVEPNYIVKFVKEVLKYYKLRKVVLPSELAVELARLMR